MRTGVVNQVYGKLCQALCEPDDATIWRYSVCGEMSDFAWHRYVRHYNVHEKVAQAKENGTWEEHCRGFLEGMVQGSVPLTAFLSADGRKWLEDVVKVLRETST